MDSSDEELFERMPSTSTAESRSTSSEWKVEKIGVSQSSSNSDVPSPHVSMKRISIKLSRVSNAKPTKQREKIIQLKKKKLKLARPRKWKYGNIGLRKRKIQAELCAQKNSKQTEFNVETVTFLKRKINDDAPTSSRKDAHKGGGCSDTDASENSQSVRNNNENPASLIQIPQEKKESSSGDRKNVCARIVPYKLHQKWKQNLNTSDTMTPDTSFLSSSDTAEQDIHSDETYKVDDNSSTETQMTKTPIATKSKLTDTYPLVQEQLKLRRKISALDEIIRKRKRQRILSTSSSSSSSSKCSSQTAPSNNTESFVNDNSINSENDMDQTISQPSVQLNRELRVSLIRLERMSNADVVKLRGSKAQHASEEVSKLQKKIERSDEREAVIRSDEEVSGTANNKKKTDTDITDRFENAEPIRRHSFLNSRQLSELMLKNDRWDKPHSSRRNTSKVKSQKREKSSLPSAKERSKSKKSDNLLIAQRVQKKYKLFKKPRVLLIRLKHLKHSFQDNKYSAAEIEHLTRNYISNVIKKSKSSLVAQAEDDKATSGTSDEQTMNRADKRLIAEDNLKGMLQDVYYRYICNTHACIGARLYDI